MRTHFSGTTAPGRPESKGMFMPLKGPWIITGQHDPTFQKFQEMKWEDVKFIASGKGILSDTLNVTWGNVAYQEAADGGIEIAAYHYDTSD